METLVSTKYQVVIPKIVRQKARVQPGQKLTVHLVGDQIILSPKRKWPEDYLKALRGKLKIKDVRAYMEKERASWE